jgi:toxin ParE1/3/4
MELKIIWTQTAKNNLKEIFDFYKINVSVSIAFSIVKYLKSNINTLVNFPYKGQNLKTTKPLPHNYYYIIVRNYKVIYEIINSNIYIITVFDTRQNPEKLNL